MLKPIPQSWDDRAARGIMPATAGAQAFDVKRRLDSAGEGG
jgi:hypothetical protein